MNHYISFSNSYDSVKVFVHKNDPKSGDSFHGSDTESIENHMGRYNAKTRAAIKDVLSRWNGDFDDLRGDFSLLAEYANYSPTYDGFVEFYSNQNVLKQSQSL